MGEMKITCPQCKDWNEFDDSLIGPAEAVMACTRCGHFFKVFDPRKEDTVKAPGWMIRKQNGALFRVNRLSNIQTWVLEGTITLQDEFSRTGQTWIKLSEIPELEGLFKLLHMKEEDRTKRLWQMDTFDVATTEFSTRQVTLPREAAWEGVKTDSGTMTVTASMIQPEPGPKTGESEDAQGQTESMTMTMTTSILQNWKIPLPPEKEDGEQTTRLSDTTFMMDIQPLLEEEDKDSSGTIYVPSDETATLVYKKSSFLDSLEAPEDKARDEAETTILPKDLTKVIRKGTPKKPDEEDE
jgi:predicted Zn finger-like uncharacterized protein